MMHRGGYGRGFRGGGGVQGGQHFNGGGRGRGAPNFPFHPRGRGGGFHHTNHQPGMGGHQRQPYFNTGGGMKDHHGTGHDSGNGAQTQHKPWITPEIRVALKARNQLAQKARHTKDAADFDALNQHKQRVNDMIEASKTIWFKENPECEEEWLHVLAKESFNNSTWCDVCDRGFPSIHKLREHEAEHATCGVDGCNYTAHQSLLEKHIKHQHISGLFQRIPQGHTKEEIDKWRAERRKNFPTSDKVAVRDAEREEARQRGEVMRLEKVVRMYSGIKDEDDDASSQKENRKQQPDWECNCKAKHLVKNSRRRVDIRRLKHQSHCQELVRIRERNKLKMEQKAKERLERIKKKQEKINSTKKEAAQEDKTEETHVSKVSENVRDNFDPVEDSDSEPEGMNGTLPMFSGIGKSTFSSLRPIKSVTEELDFGPEDKQDDPFNISDEEDYFPTAENTQPVSNNLDDLSPSAVALPEFSNLEDKSKSKGDAEHLENRKGVDSENEADECEREKDNEKVCADDEKGGSDDDDGPPEEICISKSDRDGSQKPDTEINKTSDDKTKTEQTKETSSSFSSKPSRSRKRKQKPAAESTGDDSAVKKARNGISGGDVFSKRLTAPTLLEKLLLDEIKHERNVILQCVRFVCNNAFLQPSTPDANEEKEKEGEV